MLSFGNESKKSALMICFNEIYYYWNENQLQSEFSSSKDDVKEYQDYITKDRTIQVEACNTLSHRHDTIVEKYKSTVKRNEI